MISMKGMRALGLLLASGTAFGCSSGNEDVGNAQGAQSDEPGSEPPVWVVGQPKVVAMGDQIGSDFVFTLKDGTKATHPYVSSGASYVVTGYGAFVATPNVTNGVYSKDPWECDKAEEFATGAVAKPSNGQKCYVELVPTGGNTAFGLAIAGLDANGEGIKSFTGTGPRPAAARVSPPASAGPMAPYSINVQLDISVADAMKELEAHYSPPESERNSCIKNARAAAWLDIQAHYYCNIAYSIRECYSGKLIADSQSTDKTVQRAAASSAYAKCFVGTATDPAVDTFINGDPTRAATFKYVMFTKQGVIDFNIESENAAINKFYGKNERPRRLTDTYPAFLPDQPRYEAIRQAQIAGQTAAAAAAAAAAGSAGSAPAPTPAPAPSK